MAILKRLVLIFLILTLVILSGAIYLIWQKPIMITPFTYTVAENLDDSLKAAENADILIIGDRMGLYLNQYTGNLKTDLTKELKREPKIVNWSRENEGLHRTLFKIKALKKLPPLIIYHGGSTEWFEKKFNELDRDKINYNFNQFDNEKIISLIITFPEISKAIYKKVNHYKLSELKNAPKPKLESNFTAKEIEYLYFKYELKELIDHIKRQRSNIILITTPLNIMAPPKEACPISSTNSIVEIQQEIEGLLKEGNSKDAFKKAQKLAHESMSNAKTYYLLGMSARNNAEYKLAREALTNANVYDCYNWRGNGVYNAIIKSSANHFQVEVIDFANQTMNAQIQGDEVFFDDIFPQNIFYNNLVNDLTISIKKYFNIK